jgi:hypothetical protein
MVKGTEVHGLTKKSKLLFNIFVFIMWMYEKAVTKDMKFWDNCAEV